MSVLLHEDTVIDLVFTDIEMPGAVDGFGLAKWVREHGPGLDVLLTETLPRTRK
jgi:YesN/AraC family two-component response regulator